MNSNLKILSVSNNEWIEYFSRHPNASIFHIPSWFDLLVDCYGFEKNLLALENSQGNIIAGIPVIRINSRLTGKRGIALPFSDFCPPLGETTEEFVEALQLWRKEQNLAPHANLCITKEW